MASAFAFPALQIFLVLLRRAILRRVLRRNTMRALPTAAHRKDNR
jgi:hypothetical protein